MYTYIKYVQAFVYELYFNKAIVKSEWGHAVNESQVPSQENR